MDYPFQGLGPALNILALVIVLVMSLAVVAFTIFLAMLPGLLAAKHSHPQTAAIRILGFVGLPTGFLWCIALAWALWKSHNGVNVGIDERTSVGLDSRLTRIESLISSLEGQHNLKQGAAL